MIRLTESKNLKSVLNDVETIVAKCGAERFYTLVYCYYNIEKRVKYIKNRSILLSTALTITWGIFSLQQALSDNTNLFVYLSVSVLYVVLCEINRINALNCNRIIMEFSSLITKYGKDLAKEFYIKNKGDVKE